MFSRFTEAQRVCGSPLPPGAVADAIAPWFLVPIAVGNFLGSIALGHLFDRIGRRVMITGCYVGSGVLLVATAFMFDG